MLSNAIERSLGLICFDFDFDLRGRRVGCEGIEIWDVLNLVKFQIDVQLQFG